MSAAGQSPSASSEPLNPTRIGGFARYFKRYMGLSTVVTAAVPIPVAAFRLIPAYSAQTPFLGVYTPLFAFLVLAFLFYSRHAICRWMFCKQEDGCYRTRPFAAWLPLILIALSLASIFVYHFQLDGSIQDSVDRLLAVGVTHSAAQVLKDTEASDIPRATTLIVLYLCMFLFAEAAFVVMALREYLQDVLSISETELLLSRPAGGAA